MTRSGPTRLRMRISALPAASGRVTQSGHTDVHMTLCSFAFDLVLQVMVEDSWRAIQNRLISILNSALERIIPLILWPRVFKQTARKGNSSIQLYHYSCVSLIDMVSSVDGRQQKQEQCAGSIGVETLPPKHTI